MPPCAAIECARRGESWYVTTLTSYPSSASVAAADAPASPVPTTMTVNFRLFAGLTSFTLNLWLSHLSASGPSGTFASSADEVSGVMVMSARLRRGRRGCRVPALVERALLGGLRCAVRAARGLDDMQLHHQ